MALFNAITNFASKMKAVSITVNPAITSIYIYRVKSNQKRANFYSKQPRQPKLPKPADCKRFISYLTALFLNKPNSQCFVASVARILVFYVLKSCSIMSVQTFRSSVLPPSSR